jgi:hypothetical protein
MESGGHKSEGEGDAVHGEQPPPPRITRNSSCVCSLDVTDGAVVSCSGAGGAEGALCHACGYQYPNGHPSAKQRRAHRKHCGKPASAAAEDGGAGEHEARVLFPGTVGSVAAPPLRQSSYAVASWLDVCSSLAPALFLGEVGGAAVGRGDGIGAGAAECGGGAPGSAREAGSAAADVDGTGWL